MLKHELGRNVRLSNFAQNIRRKADARAIRRLEFGFKRRIVAPTSLNNGEQVDWLVGRIAAPYYQVGPSTSCPRRFAPSPWIC